MTPLWLASEHVHSPDPWRHCFVGQEIVIRYHLPKCAPPADLVLSIRYGDRTIEEKVVHVENRRGYLTYQLLNQNFWEKGGILSYKVELRGPLGVIALKKHHLWVEIIHL